MTQNERILDILRRHPEGITPIEALNWAGSFRLAARISDLRAAGHDIITERVDGQPYCRYRLVENVPLELGL